MERQRLYPGRGFCTAFEAFKDKARRKTDSREHFFALDKDGDGRLTLEVKRGLMLSMDILTPMCLSFLF